MQGPCAGREADKTVEMVWNADSLLEAPVDAQGCPDGIVEEALAPCANFFPQLVAVLCLCLFSNGSRGGTMRLHAALSKDVLSPENEELQEDMTEPAACAPDVPAVDAAVLFHKSLRYHPPRCQVRDVLEQLVDDVRDDLQDSQGAYDRVGGWRLESIRTPDPEGQQAE